MVYIIVNTAFHNMCIAPLMSIIIYNIIFLVYYAVIYSLNDIDFIIIFFSKCFKDSDVYMIAKET